MKLIKSIRIRLTNANIDERLGTMTNSSGLKGGLSDAKISIYDDDNFWQLEWISIGDKGDNHTLRIRKRDYVLYNAKSDKEGKLNELVGDYIMFQEMIVPKAKQKIAKSGKELDPTTYYEVIQDPWQDNPPKKRSFGNDPYYLNNGAKISVSWMVRDKFSLSKGTPLINYPFGNWIGGTIWSDDNGNELPGAPSIDKDGNIIENSWTGVVAGAVWTNPDKGGELENYTNYDLLKYLYIEGPEVGDKFTNSDESFVDFIKTDKDPNKINEWGKPFSQFTRDSSIIATVIDLWKKKVPNYDKLALCEPSFYPTNEIPYYSPFGGTPSLGPTPSAGVTGSSASTPEIKLQLNVKLPDVLKVKAKEDMPPFQVYLGDIPETDPDNIFTDEIEQWLQEDDEYLEAEFDAEQESPSDIKEVPLNVPDTKTSSEVWNSGSSNTQVSGTIVKLPADAKGGGGKAYSHTKEQGYNLLNSQWIGDLITSAKSHLGHPTYDIGGTDNGNLGCASAVSMIFYRAFGVDMKNGKPVKAKPTAIEDFGSKGTSQISGWLQGNPLYQKITWTDAQPGDIMNTSRNFSTDKAGHIGIVIDVKDKDGSWAIISNSSSGFQGGGGGCIKQNYSVKQWKSVYNRNPSQTFAFRYIGPKLQPGKNSF